jgi:DNA-binding transcriptional LysR family regulator
MLINQELLRTFVVAADSATFQDAARRRHVTKSAISQQVKTLEAQLGTGLFERVGRRVRLSAEGRALADVLRREFEIIDEALDAIVIGKARVRGEVCIGAPGPFTRLWLRPRLVTLLERHPDLRPIVVFGTPAELERRLAERELDLIILVRPVEQPSIEGVPVFTEYFRAYASPAYLKANPAPRTFADFSAHRFIVYGDEMPMHRPWWRAAFGARAALRGEIVCRIANLYEMLALVEEGVGIAVLPDYFANEAVRRRTIVELPRIPSSRTMSHENKILLAWRKHAVLTARFRVVRDALLASKA